VGSTCHSLTYSLTYPLTYSLTPLLTFLLFTHSLTHSLTPLLTFLLFTHSLTHPLTVGQDVDSVTGVVRNVWSLRHCNSAGGRVSECGSGSGGGGGGSEEEEQYSGAALTDDGPAALTHSLTHSLAGPRRVFSLSMYSFRGDATQQREAATSGLAAADLMLFFYDEWAEKCSFLTKGDIVTVSGPASMVGASLPHSLTHARTHLLTHSLTH
jgi:hypothetical protein